VRQQTETAHQLRLFGGNLRRERIARQITQEELAELADLNIRTVQKIEAGQTNILVTTAVRLRNALGCPWDALLGR
jgi:transcriptional regulator with XRE-family HTH domain